MDLIAELESRIKSDKTLEENESAILEYCDSIDFSDPLAQKQATTFIQKTFEKIEQNKPLSRIVAKTMHIFLVKMSLAKLGFKDIKIIYRDKTDKDSNTGAFYRDSDKSITFFNQSVCSYYDLLWNGPNTSNPSLSTTSRLNYLIFEIHKLEHEIQHAVQFGAMKNKEIKSPEDYLMSIEATAKTLSETQGNKYSKIGNYIYTENHDQFLFELDADKCGLERTFEVLKKISPKAYELATSEENVFIKKLQKKKESIQNFASVTWTHGTNPNGIAVSATHKAAIIVDKILPQLNKQERKLLMEQYPALNITHNEDGSRKTLEQIEREKKAKTDELFAGGVNKEAQAKAANISRVYETAIESDPVLSFEKCLQHIVRLSYDSDRYFTDGGNEVKYNSDQISKELNFAKEKAIEIAKYLEDGQAIYIDKLLKQYHKELLHLSKRDRKSLDLYERKKLIFFEIEGSIYKNKEVKKTIMEDIAKNARIREENKIKRDEALRILKEFLPGFTPSPLIGSMANGRLEVTNNTRERCLVVKAYNDYVAYVYQHGEIRKNKDFIPTDKILAAIQVIYPFAETREERFGFYEDLKKGKSYLCRVNINETTKKICYYK